MDVSKRYDVSSYLPKFVRDIHYHFYIIRLRDCIGVGGCRSVCSTCFVFATLVFCFRVLFLSLYNLNSILGQL